MKTTALADRTGIHLTLEPLTRKTLQFIPGAAVLLLGVYFLLGQFMIFLQFHPHIPARDTWKIMPLVMQVLDYGWGATDLREGVALTSGAHRIVLSRVLMTLDYQFFQGQNHLIFFSAYASLIALAAMYLYNFRLLGRKHYLPALLPQGLVIVWLFSPGHLYNLLNPINTSWFTALGCSAASLLLLFTPVRLNKPTLWLLAWSLAALAAMSNFSGLLVWCLLPAAAFLRNDSRTTMLVAALLSLLVLSVYLQDVHHSLRILITNQQARELLKENWQAVSAVPFEVEIVFKAVRDTLKHLGAPLLLLNPLAAEMLSLLSVLGLAEAWRRQWPRRRRDPDILFCLFMATLCLGIALCISQTGRFMAHQYDALRYRSFVMLYWLSVSGLAVALLPHCWQWLKTLLCLGLVLVFVLIPLKAPKRGEWNLVNAAGIASAQAELSRHRTGDYRPILPLNLPNPFPGIEAWMRKEEVAFAADLEGKQKAESPPCDEALRLSVSPGWDDVSKIEWSGGSVSRRFRRIQLSGAASQGVLIPQLPAANKVTPFLPGQPILWRGYLRHPKPRFSPEELTLIFTPVLGKSTICSTLPRIIHQAAQ
ncbi:MAG: hypothetical protein OXC05_08790 [Halieaceae bacterium]|nr:hypothetical protein [Halieaceae bacterium]